MPDDHSPKTLLVVCSSPGGSNGRIVDAIVEGTRTEGIEGVATRVVEPLDAAAADVIGADLVVIAGPPKLGMINGLIKDFFERIYLECVEQTVGKPCALVFKGATDATGGLRDTEKILTGLRWKQVQPPFIVIGDITDAHLAAAAELGATLAGGLSVDLW